MTPVFHQPFGNIRHLLFFLGGLLVLVFIFSLVTGRFEVDFIDIKAMVTGFFSENSLSEELVSKQLVILWIRLPRCLMAVLVGMGLSVSGAVYQALFRNPLVSPDILGVAAGCTFGAALGLVLPGYNFSLVHALSFAFGLGAVAMAIGIARLIAVKPVIVLVLSGMVVMSFFNALLMVLKYFSDPFDELPSIVFWIMGSLTRVAWNDIFIIAPVTVAGTCDVHAAALPAQCSIPGRPSIKIPGHESRGCFDLYLSSQAHLIVAMTVATCGQISWIGSDHSPYGKNHGAGPEHERMLPVTALLGALFLLAADDVLQGLFLTAEIPVGIITALTGAPDLWVSSL